MHLDPDSAFVESVLGIVDSIPPGRVMTYGDVAAALGSRGARVVGQVMSHYGSGVAWWRVIRAGGHPPIEHEERALVHYLAEGTPLVVTTGTDAYRIAPAARWLPPHRVLGPTVDDQTRCIHYQTELDVIAIKFFCCGEYYPCHLCHAESAGHEARTWPYASRAELAVLCGVCSTELSIADYLGVDSCPSCAAPFNSGCRLHAHLYFDTH